MKAKNVIRRHAKMVFDLKRSLPLIEAIQKKVSIGDVVVDLGCGIGLLSFAAVQAGAKRVYAIDLDSEAIEFALWQAKKLNIDQKICFLNDHSFNIDLAEKADLLIQETVGALAFDENFLSTLVDAKKRFLKPKGKIIPEQVSLVGVPVGAGKKWLSKPLTLAKVATTSWKRPEMDIQKNWKLKKSEKIKGVLVWPHIVWAKGLETDCSPKAPETHWHQTYLAYVNRYPVHATVRGVKLSLKIEPHPQNPLYNSQIEWQVR